MISICLLLLGCTKAEISKHPEFDYKYFPPQRNGLYAGLLIVFVGGSEGGYPKLYNPNTYTNQGAACLSIAYFGTKKTPPELDKIKLEYIYESINHSMITYNPSINKIVLFGYSKGAELSLALSSLYPEINGVFLINPSMCSFQSPGSLSINEKSSSWSYEGNELPYTILDYEIYAGLKKKKYRELYQNALDNDFNDGSAIKVENINGPILILSGEDDIVWPSALMSNMIISRLDKEDFEYWYKHISYEKTGHTLNPLYSLGGTFIGNMKSNRDKNERIKEFLQIVQQNQ